MELRALIDLLARPEELKVVISSMRERSDLSEEEQGFLILYDRFNGHAEEIQSYLKQTREKILPYDKKPLNRNFFFRAAAVFIILLSSGLLFLLNQQEENSLSQPDEQLVESTHFQEPGIPILMGNETTIDWAQLMFALDKETPEKAFSEWQKINKTAPENDTVIYFGGIVQMKLNHHTAAGKLFQRNSTMKSAFSDRSIYFLAQIASSKEDETECKRLLIQLKQTEDADLKPFVLRELKELH